MNTTLCSDENEDSNKYSGVYPISTKKKESNLGRRGWTEKPVRLKALLSKLDLEKLDEKEADERWRNENNGSLMCINDSVLSDLESSAGNTDSKDSSGCVIMQEDTGLYSCLSNSGASLSNSSCSGCQGGCSETYGAGHSCTETQNAIKVENKMHETMTHPPLKSVVSVFHPSVFSKEVRIQTNVTPDINQKFAFANHITNNKEIKKMQVPSAMLNMDVSSAKTTPLQDIANKPGVVTSRMKTPFNTAKCVSAAPVSESQILNVNSSLYSKENVTPFSLSTPAKSESNCEEYREVFKTINMSARKDGQFAATPLHCTAYKPLCMPSTVTPVRTSIQINTSTHQMPDATPNCFSKVAPETAGNLSSQGGTKSDACQPHQDEGKYLLVNGKKYKIECLLGRGGSSKVYQVVHPDSSEHLAIKCVNLYDTEPEIAQGYHNEIELLKKLQGCENVVKMFDYEYVEKKQMLYVVLEKGETDLSKLLKSISNTSRLPIPTVISYWLEMLAAVKSIHIHGVIHSDLKPANFLVVNGHLKLIDFGIASSLQNDMTSVSKDIATGTFNYMSPEAIQDPADYNGSNKKIKINYKSDIWSLGCILYNLLYGKTPFQHIKQVWVKLSTIKNCNTQIPYPPLPEECPSILLRAMKLCLQYDPKQRPSAEELQLLPYQCYGQMELRYIRMEFLLKKIKEEVLVNRNSEDSLKAIRALICKPQTGKE